MQTPYAPPTSKVTDPPEPQDLFAKPPQIRMAAVCLWISALLALLVTAAQVMRLVPTVGASIGATAVIGLLTASLLGVIARNISERRSWARWLFIVIYATGTPVSVAAIILAPAFFAALPAMLQANIVSQFVLQTLALILLFVSTSCQWFKSRHATNAP